MTCDKAEIGSVPKPLWHVTGTYDRNITVVKIDHPLLRIPSHAIQLDRMQNKAFKFNPETEFGELELVEDQFNAGKPKSSWQSTARGPTAGIAHPQSIELQAKELDVSEDAIQDFKQCVTRLAQYYSRYCD